ncbi:MAG: 3-oxoacyl-(acyl-carrier-protein) reductase [Acidobacteria bacterium]|jgi:3-oxoacyl-[acyl-carrier protein] reductase|nr:3-oxoacyl-(acyl-carrier-protein) reductase [Acidobacteriota bacterium]
MPAPSIHAFAEKVALITDGDNPFGRAVALQLALQGAYVIVGFSQISAENKRALAELQNLGTLANAVEADVSTVEGAKRLVGETENMFGRIDLLVNCLKFRSDSTFEEITEDVYAKTFDANLKSAFFVTREAIRLMKTRPKPKIVNVVSALDTPESESDVLYASSQSALIGLTKSLAASLPGKFRVNAVAVSEKKDARETGLDAELFRPKTGISEDDAARTIVYLLSAEAIALNGQILRIQ